MRLRAGRRLAPAFIVAVAIAIACGRQGPPHPGQPPSSPLFPIGTGRDGALVVTVPTTVNICHPIASGSAGTITSADGNLGVHVGGLLLVMQTQIVVTTDSGVAPTATMVSTAGELEFVRVAESNSNGGGPILLADELKNTYSTVAGGARTAQACTVPEFTDLTIAGAGSLEASGWSAGHNGVVAALVSGVLSIASNASVAADGAGFAGGLPQQNDGSVDITLAMTSNGQGGGKGEGIDGRSRGYAGRAPAANAAGGGNAHNSGGGGGGNGGFGGFGGLEANGLVQDPATRGIGGTSILAPTPRVLFGGGGGSGHQNGSHAGAGGVGGGAVLFAARFLTGSGRISAMGGRGLDSNNGGDDGAGGGGAGGTVIVYATVTTGWTGTISVRGGDGGNLVQSSGPGGGGGGGRVYWPNELPAPSLVVLTGGTPGITGTPADGHRGATTGSSGVLIFY